MVKMSTSEPSNPSLLERILAISSLSIIAAALLSYFATLIIGLNDREAMANGWLSIVYGISFYALPAGFVLLIVLLILANRRRKRDVLRDSQRAPKSPGKSGNPARKPRG